MDQARLHRRACFLYGNVEFREWLWYTSRSVARRDTHPPLVWGPGFAGLTMSVVSVGVGVAGAQRLLRANDFDLKQTAHPNRAVALWRLITGYRLAYGIAVLSLGLAAPGTGRQPVSAAGLRGPRLDGRGRLAAPRSTRSGSCCWGVATGACSFGAGRLAAQAAEGASFRIRSYLYDHMQALPFLFHDNNATGDLLQRTTSDVEAVRKLFSNTLLGIGRSCLLITVFLTGMILLDVRMALVVHRHRPVHPGGLVPVFPVVPEGVRPGATAGSPGFRPVCRRT